MTIRIFVGCAPNHDDAESQAVLEYSMRKHASEPVDITWMKLSRDPSSPFFGWRTDDWATPFSGFRYAVPALCDFKGRAIYMDSDVIILADVAELWHARMVGDVMAKNGARLCVSLWDCSRGRLSLDDARRGVRHSLTIEGFPVDQEWNCLDGEHYSFPLPSKVKALHYTSMPHQPHLPFATYRLQRAGMKHWFDGKMTPHWRPEVDELFTDHLHMAIANGYFPENYCRDEPYGDYRKGSVASLRGAVPSWGRR